MSQEMSMESEFFKEKRPWSKIKDKVIGDYLVPYLWKVSKLRRQVIIVDAFAGQGAFENGTGGSPLIICETAEKHIPDQYLAIFVNRDRTSHQKLETALRGYVDGEKALVIYGNAQDLLEELSNVVGDATLLIYLDPFGLRGCEFELLEPYLGRETRFSTEVIINISMPTIHRLSTFRAISEGRITSTTKKLNQRLSQVLGGDYWQEIMWGTLPPAKKEQKVVEKYVGLLKKYLPYAGSCPVREKRSKRIKYYIIFCSRHKDALLLMNDIMCKAYFKTMHEIEYEGTLFEGMLDWKEMQQRGDIKEEIRQGIRSKPGITRKDLWLRIIEENFMRWVLSEFHNAVKEMVKEEKISFTSSTSRLNDNSKLYLADNPPLTHLSTLPSPSTSIPKVHYSEYLLLDGKSKTLVKRVNDGSIITRFDKTPLPEKPTDVVCPHFLELKWAYGCPFDCAWCYLKGTFRFRPEGPRPAFKPLEKIKSHVEAFFEEAVTPEILNTGEIADSLMGEDRKVPFSKFIIPIFETQKKHKILFLTKSPKIENLFELESHDQAIISFSLNSITVAAKWESAPKIIERVRAAQKLYEKGFDIRIRIDPMVPIADWDRHYNHLVDLIFEKFIPERITLGSLRGLQSTINGCTNRSWVKYLSESSSWGRKIDRRLRYQMYSKVIGYMEEKYGFRNVALCKETLEMWKTLGMDFRKIKCNCTW